MTQQQAYEELRARLNKMFPERLELKPECEVSRFHSTFTWITIDSNTAYYIGKSDKKMYQCEASLKEIEQFTVLGTPITLQEILRALPNTVENFHVNNDTLGLDCDGSYCYIDLTKPISEQSLQTLQWLLEVIPDNK